MDIVKLPRRGKSAKMTEALKVQGNGDFEGALACGLSGRKGREEHASVAARR